MTSDAFAETYQSLHILGEHILSAARHAATGRIGLTVVGGGIATPAFGASERVVGVIHGALVIRAGAVEQRAPITTLRAAGEFAGVRPGAPADVYEPKTPCDLDAPLPLDPAALSRIIGWYQLTADALRRFSAEIVADEPSGMTLWPEHFDVAIRAADVNYGGLPGDAEVDTPYLYVAPPAQSLPALPDASWNHSFGAGRTWDEIATVANAVDFFHEGRTAAKAMTAPAR